MGGKITGEEKSERMVDSMYLHEQPRGLGVTTSGVHQVCLAQLLTDMLWQLSRHRGGHLYKY